MCAQQQEDLFFETHNPENLRVLNERCKLRINESHFVVLVSGMIHAQYEAGDHMSEARAMVSLVDQGWASQIEVAQAFGCSTRTVRRHVRRFEAGGLPALGRSDGYPLGRARLGTTREKLVHKLKAQGVGQREIARRLGVTENAIRKLVRRMGWKAAPAAPNEFPLGLAPTADPKLSARINAQAALPIPASTKRAHPNLSAASTSKENLVHSQASDPSDREADRLLARLGLLEDAPPLFGSASAIPHSWRTLGGARISWQWLL